MPNLFGESSRPEGEWDGDDLGRYQISVFRNDFRAEPRESNSFLFYITGDLLCFHIHPIHFHCTPRDIEREERTRRRPSIEATPIKVVSGGSMTHTLMDVNYCHEERQPQLIRKLLGMGFGTCPGRDFRLYEFADATISIGGRQTGWGRLEDIVIAETGGFLMRRAS